MYDVESKAQDVAKRMKLLVELNTDDVPIHKLSAVLTRAMELYNQDNQEQSDD